MNKKIFDNVRFTPKGDIEANWKKAVGFIPLDKEIIIYKPDETHSAARFKVGDGKTEVNDLPFSGTDMEAISELIDEKGDILIEYVDNAVTEAIGKLREDLVANIEDGNGKGSAQQVADGVADGFDFTGKNSNAIQLDSTLAGIIPYGATGDFAVAFGGKSSAQGKRSHAEGTTTIAKGKYSHAEGDNSVALGNDSHAEGYETTSYGVGSHSEGGQTLASGYYSHAEGIRTKTNGEASHAEGCETNTSGFASHAEGARTQATGDVSHAEGIDTVASGYASHAGGQNTIATQSAQTAIGRFNEATLNSLFVVGNGSETYRQNAFIVHGDGRATVQSPPVNDEDVVRKKELDNKFDKDGGMITGDVYISGDLGVAGTTYTQDTETLRVKDNLIVANSNGLNLIEEAGFVVKTDASSAYGILYDPVGDGVKIGLGSLDINGQFTYGEDEAQFLATRADEIVDGHTVVWDDDTKQLVDSGVAHSEYVKFTDYITSTKAGLIDPQGFSKFVHSGLILDEENHILRVRPCEEGMIRDRVDYNNQPITLKVFDKGVKAVLTDPKVELSDDSKDESGNVVEGEKTKACKWLGAVRDNQVGTRGKLGLVKWDTPYGIMIADGGELMLAPTPMDVIDKRNNGSYNYRAVTMSAIDDYVLAALTTNHLTPTDEQKAKACDFVGASTATNWRNGKGEGSIQQNVTRDFVTGKNSISWGSHIAGNNCFAGGASGGIWTGSCSFMWGTNCNSYGDFNAVFGNACHAGKGSTFLHGDHVRSEEKVSIVFGQYNAYADETNYLFMLGNGTSDTERSNALIVYKDGSAKFSGTVEVAEPTADGHAAPKKWVADNFVARNTTASNGIYGRSAGNEILYSVSQWGAGGGEDSIARRTNKGGLRVFLDETNDKPEEMATPKGYVDGLFAGVGGVKAGKAPRYSDDGNIALGTAKYSYEAINKGYVDDKIAELQAQIDALKG